MLLYWLLPNSALEVQDGQDKGSLFCVLLGQGRCWRKKKKGFADDIVMLNSVLYAAGRYFFPCLSLSFFFTLLKVT